MQPKRFSLSAIQVAASVLAAVTGALAASFLGVTGTIIGAAVVSFSMTVGTAVYGHLLKRTGQRLRSSAVDGAGSRPGTQGPRGNEGPGEARPARPGPGPAGRADAGGQPGPATGREPRHRGRRWLVLAGAVVGTFVLTMAMITGIELALGKPLDSSLWHRGGAGTTVGQIVHGPTTPARGSPPPSRAARPQPPPSRAPAPSPTRSSPASSPRPTVPPTSPSGSPTPSLSPSPSPSPSPSSAPPGRSG